MTGPDSSIDSCGSAICSFVGVVAELADWAWCIDDRCTAGTREKPLGHVLLLDHSDVGTLRALRVHCVKMFFSNDQSSLDLLSHVL
jgi:hypothetical protein